jgi:hypothetical protein
LSTVGLPKSPTSTGKAAVAGLAALAFDRVEERRLLATDIGAGSASDLDLEAEAGAQDVRAQEPGSQSLVDAARHGGFGVGVLTPDVEVSPLAAGRERGDGHALEDRERVALHQHAVLEGARLRLVGVADEVVGLRGLRGDRRPLAAGGEGGSAASDQL